MAVKVQEFGFKMEGKTAHWVEAYSSTKDPTDVKFMEIDKEISQAPKRHLVVRADKLKAYKDRLHNEKPEKEYIIKEKEVPGYIDKV